MGDVPARIGKYTVERSLGSGGMGEVFLAYSPAGSPVAVKVIRSDLLDAQARARFEREAQIAATMIGSNRVARFLEADPFAAQPWLAMEYVQGCTLLQYVNEQGVLPLPLTVSLGALVAEGLEAVHAAGLLHRDLKPQNIMLGANGPMIIDFGLSAFVDASQDSLSRSGTIIGTVRCMPPEQASGNPRVTAAADVYALGTVLLYAATGHYPYDGTQVPAIVAQVVNPLVRPDLSGVPARLLPLLESMFADDPDARPATVDVAVACAALLAGAAITPVEARLLLIARTTGTAGPGPALTPSIEARLNALEELEGEELEVGPLDVPPEAPEPAEPEPASSGVPAQRRQSASARVAQQLRLDYAVHTTL
ncbi:serine/threonine-protein kinase [Dactylosporangium sp. CA-152071]|uniref:serine/threonine-protein kinase n=1 Tax=Dactylosporangium sp. CA-152071 TaxID=3239933 RepID=UPI003D92943D